MNVKGSLDNSVDTRLKIYPPKHFATFLNTLADEEDIPVNILKLIGRDCQGKLNQDIAKSSLAQLTNEDMVNMKKINKFVKNKDFKSFINVNKTNDGFDGSDKINTSYDKEASGELKNLGDEIAKQDAKRTAEDENIDNDFKRNNASRRFITTSDIDWVYSYLQHKKSKGKDVPHLHVILEGAIVEMPMNNTVTSASELEEKCVTSADREAKEYETMALHITVEDLRARIKLFEDKIFSKKSVPLRNASKMEVLSKYIHNFHKRCKAVKKEHQD